MATRKKPADEGFLTTAAQAIGSTLGQLARKTGVAAPAKKAPVKKKAAAKKPATKKKAPAKKKTAK